MIAKPFDDLNGLLSERSVGNGAAKREFDMAALLAEETKYRLLVEHIPAITYIAAIDEQSSTHYTSPQIEAILGFSQAEWKVDPTRWLKQIRVLAYNLVSRSTALHLPAKLYAGTRIGIR